MSLKQVAQEQEQELEGDLYESFEFIELSEDEQWNITKVTKDEVFLNNEKKDEPEDSEFDINK